MSVLKAPIDKEGIVEVGRAGGVSARHKRTEAGTQKAHKEKTPHGLLQGIGGDLLSHTVSRAVPSALKSLTSVFGMGTGGSSSL